MTSLDIDELLAKIKRATYKRKYTSGNIYDENLISGDDEEACLNKTVYQWATNLIDNNYLEQIAKLNAEIGELRAKVYTYEKVIEKSNFAPMVIHEKELKGEQNE